MPVPADETNPVTDNGGNGNTGNKVYPMNALPDRPRNLYDDPIAALIGSPLYKLIIVLCMIQSNNAIVFFRYRIGRRIMRGWIFQLLFVILLIVSGGTDVWLKPVGEWDCDSAVIFYALVMGILAIYHHNVGKELTETDNPDEVLHTMARGDSYLMVLMRAIPPFTVPMFHFYHERFRPVQVFPVSEAMVQRLIEPLILIILGFVFTAKGSWLGFWLVLSAVNLRIVEADYYTRAVNAYLDMFDARIESQVIHAISESQARKKPLRQKINGIATASEYLRQLQMKRLGNNA